MHVKSVARTHGQGLSLRNLECRTCREKLWSLWLVVGRVSALSSIAAYSWCFWCWNIHGIYLSACTTFIWNHTHTLTAHWKRWRPRWTGLTTWLLIGRDEFICRPGHFVQKSQKWPPGAFRHFLMKIGVIISRQFSQSGISLFLAALAALYLTLVMVSQWVTQWVSATFEFWQKDKKDKNNKNNKRKQKDKKRVWYCYVGIVSHSCNCRKKHFWVVKIGFWYDCSRFCVIFCIGECFCFCCRDVHIRCLGAMHCKGATYRAPVGATKWTLTRT